MIYLFKVYVLVIVLVFASVLILFLAAAIAAVVFQALRGGVKSGLAPWHARAGEPVSAFRHLKSKNALHGGAAS